MNLGTRFRPLGWRITKAVCSGLLDRVVARKFVGCWWPNICNGPFIASSELTVVRASLGEAEYTVRPASNNLGIVVILPVVFPEAHRADFESSSLAQRLAEAAGATKRQPGRLTIEPRRVFVEPRPPTSQFVGRRFVVRIICHRPHLDRPNAVLERLAHAT